MNSQGRGESTVTGGAHLARRSALLKRIHALSFHIDLLVVEDKAQDANFITKPLSSLFGQKATVTVAPTVDALKSALAANSYAVIVLDDNMDAGQNAETTLPLIKAGGHTGPILLVSGLFTQARRATLKRLGADAVLSKDELDSVELGERVLLSLGYSGA